LQKKTSARRPKHEPIVRVKRLFFILALFSLSLNAVCATEQDIVDRSAVTIRDLHL
jgi:hypothetical protein